MTVTVFGNGTVTGISAGGLPDGCIQSADIATGTIQSADIASGVIPAGGKILQVATTQISMTHSGNSHNTWTDTNLTLAITPTASSSTILLRAMFMVYWVNTSGDSGVSIRFKQVISGGATTYPEGISSGTNANYHTLCYHTRAIAGHDYETYHLEGVASPATTSAVTYTMQYGTYNTESAGIGMGGAKARLTLMEIGA